MPVSSDTQANLKRVQEARDMIGKGIIAGLIRPGRTGGIEIVGYYNQTQGGYWQTDGDGHTQGSGDYHQG